MKKITIGISGIHAIDNPGPGIGIARALKEDPDLDVEIIGIAYDSMEPGIYIDWLIDKSFILPYPSGDNDGYIGRLAYIKEQTGMDFIIPSLDAELPLFTNYHNRIKELGIDTYLPTIEQFTLRGKDKLHGIAESINCMIPDTKIVTSEEELISAVKNFGFPVMIKGALYKAYRAGTVQEAVHHYNDIVAEWGYPVIAQKVVEGEELNVIGVGDGTGENLGLVAIKKTRVTSLGKIWTGVTIKHQAMLDAAEKFNRTYKWKGPFELECIVKNDDIYLIEINPRFPAWSYFAAGVGINLPSNIIRSHYNMPLNKDYDYDAGKLYVRYTYEVVTDMNTFQNITIKGES